MALWGQETNLIFHAAKKDGYEVTLDFGKKGLNLGKLIEGLWDSVFAGEPFPFSGLEVPIKSVTGFLKRSKKPTKKDNKKTPTEDNIVMFRVVMGGLIIYAYHIEKGYLWTRRGKKPDDVKPIMAFELIPTADITIDNIPAVNVRLKKPIEARLGFALASAPIEFTLPKFKYDKTPSTKKPTIKQFTRGFKVNGFLRVPGVFEEHFGYENAAIKSTNVGGGALPDGLSQSPAERATITEEIAPRYHFLQSSGLVL